jgi:hypothetical protein
MTKTYNGYAQDAYSDMVLDKYTLKYIDGRSAFSEITSLKHLICLKHLRRFSTTRTGLTPQKQI